MQRRESIQNAFAKVGLYPRWVDPSADAIPGRPRSTADPTRFGWVCNYDLLKVPKYTCVTTTLSKPVSITGPCLRTAEEVAAKFAKKGWKPCEFTINMDCLYWNAEEDGEAA
jgi:hypothetical protein